MNSKFWKINFKRSANTSEIWLLLVYDKTVQENIPSHVLRKIKDEIGNG